MRGKARLTRSSGLIVVTLIWIFAGGFTANHVCAASLDGDTLRIAIGHVSGDPGETLAVPIMIETGPDTVQGFSIWTTLSRPDLFLWNVDTVVNGSGTSYQAQFDTVGTLIGHWEVVFAASPLGIGTGFNVAGVRDSLGGELATGLLPFTSGVLVYAIGTILDDVPDTLTDRVVGNFLNVPFSDFSDPNGQLIDPVTGTNGSITVNAPTPCACPGQGDMSPPPDGVITVLDVVYAIDHVFRSGPAPTHDSDCPMSRGDIAPASPGVQCGDGVVTVLDAVGLIDHVFRSGAAPCDPCSP